MTSLNFYSSLKALPLNSYFRGEEFNIWIAGGDTNQPLIHHTLKEVNSIMALLYYQLLLLSLQEALYTEVNLLN